MPRSMLRPVERRGRPTTAHARADALRAILKAIVRDDFEGNQQRAATALGITRGALNQQVNGHTAAGQPTMDGLVAYLRRPIEEIVAAAGDLAALRAPRADVRSVEVCFGALPSWPQLLEGARALAPAIPDWCWRDVADARVWVRFGALPSWPQLLEGARALAPAIPDWCWRDVADARVWVRGPVTAAMVAGIAELALRHFPPPSAADRSE